MREHATSKDPQFCTRLETSYDCEIKASIKRRKHAYSPPRLRTLRKARQVRFNGLSCLKN